MAVKLHVTLEAHDNLAIRVSKDLQSNSPELDSLDGLLPSSDSQVRLATSGFRRNRQDAIAKEDALRTGRPSREEPKAYK